MKSQIIEREPKDLYQFWSDFENLPRFLPQLKSVTKLDETRSHWIAFGPADKTVEWDAEITEDRENEFIAWRSLDGSEIENSGFVRFQPAADGRGTIVQVEIKYDPPGGTLGEWITKLMGDDPEQQAREALRRFKQLMETGEIIISDGTYWDNGLLTQRAAQPISSAELNRQMRSEEAYPYPV